MRLRDTVSCSIGDVCLAMRVLYLCLCAGGTLCLCLRIYKHSLLEVACGGPMAGFRCALSRSSSLGDMGHSKFGSWKRMCEPAELGLVYARLIGDGGLGYQPLDTG